MKELSEREHWDSVHVAEKETWDSALDLRRDGRQGRSVRRRLVLRAKRLLGERRLARMSNYEEYLLWDVIFRKHLPELKGAKVLEVGSAPGEFLVRMAERYGCEPFGVEYSETGAELNREIFVAHGIDPGNVIEADFFSEDFQSRHREDFDVVLSRGFVEHFEDAGAVVAKHLNLLKPGGRLIVNIPNLRGANYLLTKFFHKDLIPIHNLDIMSKDSFARLFGDERLMPLFCEYYGTFNFYLFYTKGGGWKRAVLSACYRTQPALNYLFRALLKDRGAESPAFSPSLIFIGIKK